MIIPQPDFCRFAATAFVLMIVMPASADNEFFDLREIGTANRIVAARVADFDGDGRQDLMTATIVGIPPDESRQVQLYFQDAHGALPDVADQSFDIPPHSAVYDVADIDNVPGAEILFLRSDRITTASLAKRHMSLRDIGIDGPPTAAAASDERGFDYHKLVYDDFERSPLILVPQIGALSALSHDGQPVARMATGRRANYIIAREQSLVAFESDIQLFLDIPRLNIGDVNGDGRNDIVSNTRHEIRVFLQEGDGRFPEEPSIAQALHFISARDHMRGSGGLAATLADYDVDGRADLLVSHVEGSLVDTVTTTYLFRNRGGRWNFDSPDETFHADKTLSSDLLLNLDEDPQLELVRVQIKFTVLELVELLLQRKIDAVVAIHQLGGDRRYPKKPWSEKKLSTGFSFDTFRPKGFIPRGEVDLNNDGFMDFVTSADGDGIEVYLGGTDGPFERRAASQDFPSAGRLLFEDLNGDGLADFVIYNPSSPGSPIRIGVNRGRL